MEVERPEPVDISELNFVDDEDLQASLAKARRLATKKTIKKLTPEQIAKNRKHPRRFLSNICLSTARYSNHWTGS